MKCYVQLFSKKGILKNIGFYSIAFIILFYFISIILFYKKYINIINNNIKDISFVLKIGN